jgi:hypothetical protein
MRLAFTIRRSRDGLEADALGTGNMDQRGWRFAPHGWAQMGASLDPELDGLLMNFGTPRLRWR